jgi:hypothetical protein
MGENAPMSVEEIKKSLTTLSAAQRSEVTAFLFHLRRAADPEYQSRLDFVLADKTPEHWVTPEEFEKRLDGQ